LSRSPPSPGAPPAEAPRPRSVVIANRHPRLRVPRAAVARMVRLLDAEAGSFRPPRSAGVPVGELSLVFLADADLARLHADFLDDPTPTDVITFEGDAAAGLAGEICVSVDMAARVARGRRGGFAAELTLYLVHGWLHLAGHDDLAPAKKRRMRAAEKRALNLLRRHRAIPGFQLG